MTRTSGQALPRVGLLGNPSDGYGGKVIAFTIMDFGARVSIEDADVWDVAGVASGSWSDLVERLPDLEGSAALLVAATRKLAEHCRRAGHGTSVIERPVRIEAATGIPFQVGLAGSSAIVVAALRAWMARLAVDIDPITMADLALRAETEELGATAGPQDRVIQACEGLMHMDFRSARPACTRLDVSLLPPLFVAWDPHGGRRSSIVHDDVRRRFEQGDAGVRRAMERFADLADEGLVCLQEGNTNRLRRLLNENFDLRASIWTLSDRDREMVALGRAHGAGVKFCGSGGSVVGMLRNRSDLDAVAETYRGAGYAIVPPRVGGQADQEHAR